MVQTAAATRASSHDNRLCAAVQAEQSRELTFSCLLSRGASIRLGNSITTSKAVQGRRSAQCHCRNVCRKQLLVSLTRAIYGQGVRARCVVCFLPFCKTTSCVLSHRRNARLRVLKARTLLKLHLNGRLDALRVQLVRRMPSHAIFEALMPSGKAWILTVTQALPTAGSDLPPLIVLPLQTHLL